MNSTKVAMNIRMTVEHSNRLRTMPIYGVYVPSIPIDMWPIARIAIGFLCAAMVTATSRWWACVRRAYGSIRITPMTRRCCAFIPKCCVPPITRTPIAIAIARNMFRRLRCRPTNWRPMWKWIRWLKRQRCAWLTMNCICMLANGTANDILRATIKRCFDCSANRECILMPWMDIVIHGMRQDVR